jgi:hypothetical protein
VPRIDREVPSMTEQSRPRWAVRLQTEREARGWSKYEMGRRLLLAAGIEQGSVTNLARQIRDWEKGAHFPRDWAATYAVAFEIPAEQLFGPSMPQSGASFMHGFDHQEDDVRRRALLAMLAAAAATGPFAQEGERRRMELLAAVDADVTERDADAWERVAFDYAHEVGRVPDVQVLPELLTDIEELHTLIGRSRDPIRKRLIHSAAHLAAFTAMVYIGLGHSRNARRWWRSAARAADESGDEVAASLMRGKQAIFSLYEDRSPLAVIDTAEEAIAVGRNVPCPGVASGYAAKAQALARLERSGEARETLEDLQSLFEGLPDAVVSDRSSQWGWSAQRLHHVASYVHTHAGDVPRAGAAQDQALALYPVGSYRGRTQVELHRAGCLIRAGDVDEGAQHTVQVLERIPSEFRSDLLVRRTALHSLSLAPPSATARPPVRDAYELLALPPGHQ